MVRYMNFLFIFVCFATLGGLCQQLSQSTANASPQTGTQASSADPGAIKARQLINEMLQALGGDAYLHYTDIEQDGRTNSFYHGQPTGGTAPFWRFYKFPDKERIELTKQRDWIVIHNGDRGTETTLHGTKTEADDLHRDFQHSHQEQVDNRQHTS